MKTKRKLIALLLSLTTLFALAVPAYAEDVIKEEAGTQEVTVTAVLNSSYSVKMPAAITLERDGDSNVYLKEFVIGAKGNIKDGEKVFCLPLEDTYTLTSAEGETAILNILGDDKDTGGNSYWFWVNENPNGENGEKLINHNSYNDASHFAKAEIDNAGSYSATITFQFGIGT